MRKNLRLNAAFFVAPCVGRRERRSGKWERCRAVRNRTKFDLRLSFCGCTAARASC